MEEKNFNHSNKRLFLFIGLVILSIIVNCLIYYRNTSHFENRQKRIVTIIDKEIKMSDTKELESVKFVSVSPNRQDSLYADLMTLHESTLKHQSEFLQGVRDMMNLEYNKIQNEYDNQELWVGLITIVFLIFSFYSMFKSDQLEQQSSENARAINEMVKSTLKKINEFESAFNTKLDDIQTRGTRKIDELEAMKAKSMENLNISIEAIKNSTSSDVRDIARASIDSELNSFRNAREERLSSIADKWNKEIEVLKGSAETEIRTVVSTQLEDCNKRINTFITENQNNLSLEIERLLNSFDDQKSQIVSLIDERVRVVLEANMATQEDIDAMMREIFEEKHPQEENTGVEETDGVEADEV